MREIIFVIALGVIVGALYARFPYALNEPDAAMRLLYLCLLALFVGVGVFASRKRDLSRMAKEAFGWLAILLSLVGIYAYRDVFLGSRVAHELMPHRAQVAEGGESLSLLAAGDGHFYAEAYVNGVPVRFMVDTGASDVVLTQDDARALGLPIMSLEYDRVYRTANGTVRGASVTLDYIELGNIRVDGVRASVNEGEMEISLLGMSFLRQLSGYRVEGNTLTLVP